MSLISAPKSPLSLKVNKAWFVEFDIAVLNISTEEKISDDINDAYVWYYSNPTKAKATVLVTEEKLLEGMMVKKINVNRRKNGYSI